MLSLRNPSGWTLIPSSDPALTDTPAEEHALPSWACEQLKDVTGVLNLASADATSALESTYLPQNRFRHTPVWNDTVAGLKPFDRVFRTVNKTTDDSTPVAESESSNDIALLVEKLIDGVIARSLGEDFEPGIESELARDLERLNRIFPKFTLAALRRRAAVERNIEVLCEIMRWLGRSELSSTERDELMAVLSVGLKHESRFVRDSAMLALSQIGGEQAARMLEDAAGEEAVPELRADMRDVIGDLRQARDGLEGYSQA